MTLNRHSLALGASYCALCVAAASMAIGMSAPSVATPAWIVAGLAGACAILILQWQASRDLDAVLALIAGFAIPVALVLGIYVLSAGDSGPLPKGLGALCGIIGVACLVATFRRQRAESVTHPNILARLVDSKGIVETDGVQFAGTFTPAEAREAHWATIVLQNCFDGPRTATVYFDGARHREYMRFHPKVRVTLGPGEVAEVATPVVAPTSPGSYHLYFSVRVEGTSGHRVRLWRARAASTRTTGAQTAAMLAAGVLVTGGGMRFTVGPLPHDIWAEPLADPIVETLWPKVKNTNGRHERLPLP